LIGSEFEQVFDDALGCGRVETTELDRQVRSEATVPSIPRIARVLPQGPITRPGERVPVIAHLRWASGREVDVPALAVAWTHVSVEIRWDHDGAARTDWISARDVRRRPVSVSRFRSYSQ
jgi:hypothetical protein